MQIEEFFRLSSQSEALAARAKELAGLADTMRQVRNNGTVSLHLNCASRSGATKKDLKTIENLINSKAERLGIGYEMLFQVELSLRQLAREAKLKSKVINSRMACYLQGDSND